MGQKNICLCLVCPGYTVFKNIILLNKITFIDHRKSFLINIFSFYINLCFEKYILRSLQHYHSTWSASSVQWMNKNNRKISQFSSSAMSNSLRPHGLQHARIPYPFQLLEHTQTHVHWVSDVIQTSHPMSSLTPPNFKHSHHQSFFKCVRSLHQVPKVLEFQLQH